MDRRNFRRREKRSLVTVKKVKKVVTRKCAYPGCSSKSIGGSNFCKVHGGSIIDINNTVPALGITGKFDPEKHPVEYLKLARQGFSKTEIAAEFEVSIGTLNKWIKTYEQMAVVADVAEEMHTSWWIREGKNNLDNRGYNTNLFKFMAGNMLGWSDKIESRNLNVTAGVLKVHAELSVQDWEKTYAGGQSAEEKT